MSGPFMQFLQPWGSNAASAAISAQQRAAKAIGPSTNAALNRPEIFGTSLRLKISEAKSSPDRFSMFLFEWVYWNNYHTFRCIKRKLAAAIRQSKKGTAKRRRYPDTDPAFACYEYRMFFHIMFSVELAWWFTRTFWVSGHLKMRLCNPSTEQWLQDTPVAWRL